MYLLVRRMQERQPVAIHTGNLFALFDEQGVSLHAAECMKSSFFIPPGTWALSDPWHGDKEIHGPCMAFEYSHQASYESPFRGVVLFTGVPSGNLMSHQN